MHYAQTYSNSLSTEIVPGVLTIGAGEIINLFVGDLRSGDILSTEIVPGVPTIGAINNITVTHLYCIYTLNTYRITYYTVRIIQITFCSTKYGLVLSAYQHICSGHSLLLR